ncbi:MAG TPA: ankyrin repeat domain-containing protein, partial [Candidatus Lokiarchaeia archaeon]
NIMDKDEKGRNGLMTAIYSDRNIEFIEYLIKLGIDINAKDNKGYTALMMCVYTDFTMDYVDFLIEKGTDVNIVNNENMTALDIALKYEDTGSDYTNVYIINVLKEAGAKRAKDL